MQFSGQIGQIVCWRAPPRPQGVGAPLWETLDLPLLILVPVPTNSCAQYYTTHQHRCSIAYQPPNPPILSGHPPENNGPPPLTLGKDIQLCWLLPLTLQPSA